MAAPSLSLHIDNGRRKGETLTLDPNPNDQIRIGRIIRGNTFTIKDPSISQHHLAISFLPALSLWSLTDLSSSNGTHLNNTLIPPDTPAPLSHGDLIRIGETTRISVRVPAPPTPKQKFGNPEDFKRDGPARREGGRPTRASSRVVNRGVKLDEENIDVVDSGSESGAEMMDGEKLSKAEEIRRDGRARRKGGKTIRASSRVMNSMGLGNIDVAMGKNLDVEKLSKVEEEIRRDGRARRRVVGKKVVEKVVMESKSGRRTRGLSRAVNSMGLGVKLNEENIDVVGTGSEYGAMENNPSMLREKEVEIDESGRRTRASSRAANSMGLGVNLDEENIEVAMENNVCVEEERMDVEKLSKPEEIRRNVRGRRGVVEHKSGRRPRASSRAVNNMGLGMKLDEENIDVVGSHLEELGATENNVYIEEEDRTGSRAKEAEDEKRVDEEMDKMTMAEWFDRMEEFLPKEINKVAEEIIESIREKACRFDEYIDHLAKSKYN